MPTGLLKQLQPSEKSKHLVSSPDLLRWASVLVLACNHESTRAKELSSICWSCRAIAQRHAQDVSIWDLEALQCGTADSACNKT